MFYGGSRKKRKKPRKSRKVIHIQYVESVETLEIHPSQDIVSKDEKGGIPREILVFEGNFYQGKIFRSVSLQVEKNSK